MQPTSSPFHRLFAAIFLVLLCCCLPSAQAQNTDLPNPTPNIQTAPAGTWVIAMDNTLQANPGHFNMKAYGLVVKILNAERSVRWVIKSGKAKDAADFSAMASRVFPTTAAASMRDFKAGPLLVFPQDTAGLTAVIQAFNNAQTSANRVNVYQLSASTQVDVRYVLTQKPRGAILNDGSNAKIHADYYVKAGIDSPMNWRVTNAVNLIDQCYTFASEPHSSSTGPTIDSIKSYVMRGGNFLAQCLAVNTYENAANGGFHTTNGINISNLSTSPNFAYPNPDLSFSQYEGRFDPFLVGGAEKNWRAATGSAFVNDHHKHQSGALPSDPTVIGQSVAKLSTGRGHLVFYTGGHDYDKNNTIDLVNGMRSFFNAYLTPSGLTQCDFLSFATDISVQKTVNDGTLCLGDTTSFRITVQNSGSTAASPTAVTVRDLFPSTGLSINSSNASAGSYSAATGIWNVGTMLPGASETLVINVTAIDSGLFVNTAFSDKYPGDSNAANDTSRATVQVFAPQVVALPPVTACGSYTLPWGPVVTTSGTYISTYPSVVTGCDSTITLNVTITAVSPEVCNGLDDDCNGLVDDGLTYSTYYTDDDNDGYGAGPGVSLCSNPGPGFATTPGDCDDNNAAINPGAAEQCNGIDDDCDGQIDEGLTGQTYYTDADGDGYGDENATGISSCVPIPGSATNNDDCNDNNIAINPGATEICNGIDDDCDGQVDEETGDPLGSISGTGIACVPLAGGSATFSVPLAAGVTNYFWTLPPGATIVSGQNTNTVTLGWTTSDMHNTGIIGSLSVTGAYVCGTSAPSTIQLDLNFTVPVRPPSPSGPTRVCPGDVATYSISPVARTRSYFWITPPGMVITSGQGTNIIQVAVDNTFAGGDLKVEARNSCGSSPVRIKTLGLNLALSPEPISGPASGICGANGVIYSTAGPANATSYLWTVPAGVTLLDGQGPSTITVDISNSFGTGSISVRGVNGCGPGTARSLSIQGKPFITGNIAGSQNICPGALNIPYSIGTASGATSYTWTPPGGSTVSSGQGTKNILVNYGLPESTNQTVTVRASNACGISNAKTLGGIAISNSFCGPRLSATDPVTGTRFTVRPNPVKDLVSLEISMEQSERLTLHIADLTGRIVYAEQLELTEGSHTIQRDFSALASGIYAIILDTQISTSRQMIVVE